MDRFGHCVSQASRETFPYPAHQGSYVRLCRQSLSHPTKTSSGSYRDIFRANSRLPTQQRLLASGGGPPGLILGIDANQTFLQPGGHWEPPPFHYRSGEQILQWAGLLNPREKRGRALTFPSLSRASAKKELAVRRVKSDWIARIAASPPALLR